MAKRSFLGVEIGNSRLKLAETKNQRLVRFATEDMPDDIVRQGEIVQWEAMADFLKDSFKKNGFSCKNAAVVVPDSIAYTRRTRMPPMSAAQLEYNLTYEFHDFISDEKNKYIYDYSMVGLIKDAEGNVTEMDMLAVAVSKEIMDNYLRMFKRAGLKLTVAAPENRALGNACRRLNPQMTEHDFAVLDIGAGGTKIDIFSKGIYQVTRTIDAGCRTIAGLIADATGVDPHIAEMQMRENKDNILLSETCTDLYGRIAIDVMRAINYYTFENRDNTLETMYYCGGGSNIDQLINEIRDTIQLHLVPLTALMEDDGKNGSALIDGPAAVGICWND